MSANTGAGRARDPEAKEGGETRMEQVEVQCWVGIDWGHAEHQVCAVDAAGQIQREGRVAHGGAGLAELAGLLRTLGGGDPRTVAIAIEVPHGPVVETLLEHGFAVWAINPKQLDRFRDRFTMAGAKDDRRDAHVLADALRTDARSFRRLVLDPDAIIELRDWSRLTDDLTQERTRLGNRLRAQLIRYYPQFLAVTEDVAAPWVLALLELVPTPARAATVRRAQIAALLKRYRVRAYEAATVWQTLRGPGLPISAGTIAGATARVAALVPQLHLVNAQLARAQKQLDRLTTAPEDAEPQRAEQRIATIVRSVRGVGPIVTGALLGAAWAPLQRGDYHALRLLGGCAPVTVQSGKSRRVVRRYAYNKRLGVALHHAARNVAREDDHFKTLYASLRQRGCTTGRARRTVADRLLALLSAMIRDNTMYNPAHPRKAA